MKKIILTIIFIALTSLANADTITLNSGRIIEGKIIKDTPYYVSITDKLSGKDESFLTETIDSIEKTNKEKDPRKKNKTQQDSSPIEKKNRNPYSYDAATRNKDIKNENLQEDDTLRIYGNTIVQTGSNIPKLAPKGIHDYLADQKNNFKNISSKLNERDIEIFLDHIIEKNEDSVGFWILFASFFFIFYVLAFLPLFLIAKKISMNHCILAWIPIANIYLLCKMAGKSGWWMFLLLIPFLNIIIISVIWMNIAEACDRPSWIGIFILVPVASFFLPWYLAFSKFGRIKTIKNSGENFKSKASIQNGSKDSEKKFYDQIVPPQDPDNIKRF